MGLSIYVGSKETASFLAATHVAGSMNSEHSPCVGLATGSSPTIMYNDLLDLHKQKKVDLYKASYVMLDEYLALEPNSQFSFRKHLLNTFLTKFEYNVERFVYPEIEELDSQEIILNYLKSLEGLSVTLQILGIGRNGHIGFNEPGSPFDIKVQVVDLSLTTKKDMFNNGWPINSIPDRAVTQGIGQILEAKSIVLLVFGSNKAKALSDAIEGPISVECPASALRLHNNVKIYADLDAIKLLTGTTFEYIEN